MRAPCRQAAPPARRADKPQCESGTAPQCTLIFAARCEPVFRRAMPARALLMPRRSMFYRLLVISVSRSMQ